MGEARASSMENFAGWLLSKLLRLAHWWSESE